MKNLIRISLFFVFALSSISAFSFNTQFVIDTDSERNIDIIRNAEAQASQFIIRQEHSDTTNETKPKKK